MRRKNKITNFVGQRRERRRTSFTLKSDRFISFSMTCTPTPVRMQWWITKIVPNYLVIKFRPTDFAQLHFWRNGGNIVWACHVQSCLCCLSSIYPSAETILKEGWAWCGLPSSRYVFVWYSGVSCEKIFCILLPPSITDVSTTLEEGPVLIMQHVIPYFMLVSLHMHLRSSHCFLWPLTL